MKWLACTLLGRHVYLVTCWDSFVCRHCGHELDPAVTHEAAMMAGYPETTRPGYGERLRNAAKTLRPRASFPLTGAIIGTKGRRMLVREGT